MTTSNEQDQINEQILSSLHDILGQNRKIVEAIDSQRTHFDDEMHQVKQKIDHLEQTITKKATTAGAIAGAVAGTATSSIFMVGMEIIKAKFGG
ncbi:MAG: hypothetical protein Q3971_06880 [Moraxella sp.]|nr:hypothetical protein [Moraxella sp.]